MSIDLDAYLEVLEPPAFTVNGHTYTGVLLSTQEWAPFEARFRRAARGELTEAASADLITAFVRASFPPDPARPRRWWHRRTRTTADVFLALPRAAQLTALQDFCVSQAKIPPAPGTSKDSRLEPAGGSTPSDAASTPATAAPPSGS